VAPRTFTALDGALPSVEQFATAVRPGLRVAPPVLRKAAEVFVQLHAVTRPGQLPQLISNLRPALVALPGFTRDLRALFPLVTPVTDCVRDRAIPVLNTQLDDGRLSTGRPVWQDLGHAVAGLTGATQDFDGNGLAVRYLVGAGPDTVRLGGGLSGRTNTPLLGARPHWLGLGQESPFRPDAPCRDQQAPDLKARTTGGLTAARTRPAPVARPQTTRTALRNLLARIQRDGISGSRNGR
jgi:hypothetical protein